MKTFQTAILVGACALSLAANSHAALVHLYEFNNNLNDSVGNIALVNNGGTLNPTSLSFGANQGPTFNGEAGLADNYSIGLQFSLSDLTGWRKVIDFKNLISDGGQYLKYGSAYLLPTGPTGVPNLVIANTIVDFLVTRDGASGIYTTYLNGNIQYSYADSVSQNTVATLIGGNSVFQFFQDDHFTSQTEASAGTVHEIRVWNSALTRSEIADAFAPVPEPSTYLAGALLLLPFGLQGIRHLRCRKQAA